MRKIIIIGGGLAGLTAAILLKRAGHDVLVIEKKHYPFHRVCGEYISHEVTPFLKRNGLFPKSLNPTEINSFLLTSVTGKAVEIDLDMGGFGVSRFAFDDYLYTLAKKEGVEFQLNQAVKEIVFQKDMDQFELKLLNGDRETCRILIGAYGKRSNLDKNLDRSFLKRRSPYIGVKYHIKWAHNPCQVELHNFHGGYCGLNKVENDISNLCYLGERKHLKAYGNIPQMEKAILHKNSYLKKIFEQAEFIFERPEVINEISFETKQPVDKHVLMIGDAAGMITPLCGNGMAMAIHSAKILSENVTYYFDNSLQRKELEKSYAQNWKQLFAKRLEIGRQLQKLFGHKMVSGLSISLIKAIKPLARQLVKLSHGKTF